MVQALQAPRKLQFQCSSRYERKRKNTPVDSYSDLNIIFHLGAAICHVISATSAKQSDYSEVSLDLFPYFSEAFLVQSSVLSASVMVLHCLCYLGTSTAVF